MNNRYTTHTTGTLCAMIFVSFGGLSGAAAVFNQCDMRGAHITIGMQQGQREPAHEEFLTMMVEHGCRAAVQGMEDGVRAGIPAAASAVIKAAPLLGYDSPAMPLTQGWWNGFKAYGAQLDAERRQHPIQTTDDLVSLIGSRSVSPDDTDLMDANRIMGGQDWQMEPVNDQWMEQYARSVSPPAPPPSRASSPSVPASPHFHSSSAASSLSPPPSRSSHATPPFSPIPFPDLSVHAATVAGDDVQSLRSPHAARSVYSTPARVSPPRPPLTPVSLLSSHPRTPRSVPSPPPSAPYAPSTVASHDPHGAITGTPFGRLVNEMLTICRDTSVEPGTLYLTDESGDDDVEIMGIAYTDGSSPVNTTNDLRIFHRSAGPAQRKAVRKALRGQLERKRGFVRILLRGDDYLDLSDNQEPEIHLARIVHRRLLQSIPGSSVRSGSSVRTTPSCTALALPRKPASVGPSLRISMANTDDTGSVIRLHDRPAPTNLALVPIP